MFRPFHKWTITALTLAAVALSPLMAEAATRRTRHKRTPDVRYSQGRRVVTPYGTYRNTPDGPPVYNTTRMHMRVPAVNPVPPFGYYGGQQYYSQWVPTGYYNFR
jgi:hypothetical protein